MVKPPKRPRDAAQLAKFIGEIAVGERAEPESARIDEKAKKRGDARAAKLSPERKRAIAKNAAKARWKK
jgi:hypothetical protein